MKSTQRMFFRQALVALAMGCATLVSAAQDFKIGFVSTDRIFRESAAAKAAQAKLEQEFSRREREVEALRSQLKSASEKLDKEAPTLSESQRVTRQRQLVDMDRELQRKSREFQEDLNLRKNEELQQVLERANRVVKQVAESEKYDLIIQDAVYINPKHDITDKVLSGLNGAK
jgi:outer membrane protein